MLRSAVVKAVVLVPVRYVLVCFILVVVLAGLSLLYLTGAAFDPGQPITLKQLSIGYFQGVRDVFPVAVLCSVIVTLFRILRLSRFRFLAILTLFVVSGASLLVGIHALRLVENSVSSPSIRGQVIEPRVVYRFGDDFLYVGSRRGLDLYDVTVYRNGAEPGFQFSPRARIDAVSGQVRVPATDTSYRIADSETSFLHMFAAGPVLNVLFGDVQTLTMFLWTNTNWHSSLYLATVLAVILYVISLWFLVRLTRWPLFNGILAFGALRLLFLGYAAIEGPTFRELVRVVVKTQYTVYVAPAIILLVALVLVIVNLFMPSFDLWKREVVHE